MRQIIDGEVIIYRIIRWLPTVAVSAFLWPYSALNFVNSQNDVAAIGSAAISSPDPNTVQINQSSNKAIINWQFYNIASNQHVMVSLP